MKEKLIPISTVVTPNIPEAIELTGTRIENVKEMEEAAKLISEMGCKNVLVKGGHLKDETINGCII